MDNSSPSILMQLKARHIVAAFRNQVVSATNKTVRYPGWDSRTCTFLYLGIYEDAVAIPITRLSTGQIEERKERQRPEGFSASPRSDSLHLPHDS
jgi:hypothetical protein